MHKENLIKLIILIFIISFIYYIIFNPLNYNKLNDERLKQNFICNISGSHWNSIPLFYNITNSCNDKQKIKIIRAMDIITNITDNIIVFKQYNPKERSNIKKISFLEYYCDIESENVGPPSYIRFGQTRLETQNNLFISANIFVYTNNRCGEEDLTIELHEILHAFGFDHSSDKNDIMYPQLVNCGVNVSQYYIDYLKQTYGPEHYCEL